MDLLLLESDQSKKTELNVSRVERPVSERLKRATKSGGPWLLVAIVTAFVPILHFVLVPAALIAMVWFVVREMTTLYGYRELDLKCPECSTSYTDQEFARLPTRVMCFHCKVSSTLHTR